MKKAVAIILICMTALQLVACDGRKAEENSVIYNNSSKKTDQDQKILVAYFSRMGNMDQQTGLDATSSASVNLIDGKYVGNVEIMADYIAQKVQADLRLIKTKEPYSSDYATSVEQGEGQNHNNIRPELSMEMENLKDYDTVFLGYPMWNYTIPVAVASFLEKYDLAGKKIVLFGSSGGSQISGTIDTVSKLQPDADVSGGLTIKHNDILKSSVSSTIDEWLKEGGY